jgi:hypothetical protein
LIPDKPFYEREYELTHYEKTGDRNVRKEKVTFRAFSICLIGLLSLWGLSHYLRDEMSFYYDEVFDLVSIYGLPNMCQDVHAVTNLSVSIGCIPIQSGVPYVGAVRTFLLFPIVKLGLLTPSTLTMIMLTVYLIALYQVKRLMDVLGISRRVNISIIVLFALTPSLWLNSAFDFGPISIQFLLRTLLLIEVFRQLNNPERGFLRIFLYSALLIWGKLDSLFFLFFPLLIVAFNTLKIQKVRRKSGFWIYSNIILYLVSFGYALRISQSSSDNLISHAIHKITTIIPTNLIYSVFNIVYPNQAPSTWLILGRVFFFLTILLTVLNLAISLKRFLQTSKPMDLFYILCSLTTLGVIASVSLVSNATAPWHTFLIFPSAIIVTANMIDYFRKKFNAIKFALAPMVILSSVLVLNMNVTFLKVPDSKINPLLSSTLVEEVDKRIEMHRIQKGNGIAFVNWGDYNRFLLTRKSADVVKSDLWDAWPWFDNNDKTKTTEFLNWVTVDGPWGAYNKILFVQSSLSAPGLKSSLIDSLEIEGWRVDKIDTFSDENFFVNFVILVKST